MRPHGVLLVARRHLRELARERKTLIGIVAIPLLVVVITSFARQEIVSEVIGRDAAVHVVGIDQVAAPTAIASHLGKQNLDVRVFPDIADAVRRNHVGVGLAIPGGVDDAIERGAPVRVEVLVARRTVETQLAEGAAVAALESYGTRVLVRRLEAAGLPRSAARPIEIAPVDLASQQQRAGSFLADLLPFLLAAQVMGMMTGLAIDATAGEKERRTVEALLVTPLRRREILAGKWLVIVGTGIVAAVVTLVTAGISFRATVAAASGGGTIASIPMRAWLVAAAGAAGVALTAGALQVAIGTAARSVQQAGVFLGPLMAALFIPLTFFLAKGGASVGLASYAWPLLGPVLLIRFGIVSSQAAGAVPLALLTSVAYASAGLLLAGRLFRSERALARA